MADNRRCYLIPAFLLAPPQPLVDDRDSSFGEQILSPELLPRVTSRQLFLRSLSRLIRTRMPRKERLVNQVIPVSIEPQVFYTRNLGSVWSGLHRIFGCSYK
jgi:hypothetical protein